MTVIRRTHPQRSVNARSHAVEVSRHLAALRPIAGEHSRQVLERDLGHAMARQQMRVQYQPIVSLPAGEIVGVEALVAWDHPEQGSISPFEFIPMAERSGLIVELGRWVLEEACDQVRRWRSSVPGLRDLRLAVNVSARQLTPELLAAVDAALGRSGLPADCLDLDITESAVMADLDAAVAVLSRLGAKGVGISIDDFGTAMTALTYLTRIPVTALKIDKSFVDELPADGDRPPIAAGVIALAAAFGYRPIAEGVETTEQRDALVELGCAQAQGFVFSRPLAPNAFVERVASLLPVAEIPAVPEPPALAERRGRVVICDDEESIRRLYLRVIASSGVDIVEADDAIGCLAAVGEAAPDLVVLDVTLPGRGGLEILAEVRERCPEAHIVVISGLVSPELAAQAIALGADDCVAKMQFLPQLRSLVGSIGQ